MQIPFAALTDQSLLMHVVVGRNIPTRPEKVIPTRSIDGDKLWAVLTKCWSYDPEDRPSAEAVWNDVSAMSNRESMVCSVTPHGFQMKPITAKNLQEIEGKDEGESKDKSKKGKSREGKSGEGKKEVKG